MSRVVITTSHVAVCVVLFSSSACFAFGDLAEFAEKPETWKCGLATERANCPDNDIDVVWDNTFAEWVDDGRAMLKTNLPAMGDYTVRCTFTQCFGGGFLAELGKKPLLRFGANSASKYFQPSSVIPGVTSRYANAWSLSAIDFPDPTDREITVSAADALETGVVEGIPRNPFYLGEEPQYFNKIAPPGALKTANVNIAVLFAGKPDPHHLTNVSLMYQVLTDQYLYDPDNIYILYGCHDADKPVDEDVDWNSDARATYANLKKAISADDGFVAQSITDFAYEHSNGQPERWKGTAQVFFWATDHGVVRTPLSFSVDAASIGQDKTGVRDQIVDAGGPEGTIYEGGTGTNAVGWSIPGVPPDDIDAISFGNDPVEPFNTDDKPGLYFSVDRLSVGQSTFVAGETVRTDVNKEVQPGAGGAGSAANDIYTRTAGVPGGPAGWNRLFMRQTALGLWQAALNDDLNALSLVPINKYIDPVTKKPTVEIYFSRKGSAEIEIYNPVTDTTEVVWDPALDAAFLLHYGVAPDDIDAIAFNVAGAGKLLFSVPNGDPFFGFGCHVWEWPAVGPIVPVYTCAQLGLLNTDDVNAIHPFGTDPGSKPICKADLDFDGSVDAADLLPLLASWGPCEDCPADFDGNDEVGVSDLLTLLASWGLCP